MTRPSRSPFASLPTHARPALPWLGVAAVVKAIALVLIAEGLAQGITAIIDGSDAWERPVLVGSAGVVVRALVEWAQQVIARRAALGVKEDIRLQVARRVLARGGRDLDTRAGGLTSLATGSLDELDSYYTAYLPALAGAVTIPVIIGARILLADWVSAAIILITIPLIPIFMVLIGTYTEDRVEQSLDAIGRLSDHLVELARGLPVLVGLGRAQEQTSALREIADGVRRKTLETLRVAFLSSLALELIATLSVAVVAVFIGVRLVNGTISLETGLLALILAPECYLPLRQVGMAHHASEDGIEALARLRTLVDAPRSRLAPADRAATSAGPAHVRVEGLTVRYAGRPQPAVADLSFEAGPGETVALAGPSGAGKSSVIAVLAGLLGTMDDGTEVHGTIRGVDPDRIAWVPQLSETFAGSVLDEIVLALESGPEREAMVLLRHTGADGVAHRDPAELSQGELRRVALARALARVERGATLLLLDEPTAHLDPITAGILLDVIRDLHGRVTIVLVAHDAATRALADREVTIGAVSPAPGRAFPKLQMDVVQEPQRASPSAPSWIPAGSLRPVASGLLRPMRRPFALAIGMGVAAALSAVALTSLSGWLIVRASQQPPILMLMVAIVGVRFFGIGRAVFRYLQRLWLHDAIFRALRDLRVTVWEAIARVGPAAKRLLRGDQALDRLIGDIDSLRDIAPRVLVPPLIGVLAALVATAALWVLLPAAGMVMLASTLISTLVAPFVAIITDRSARSTTVETRSAVLRAFASLVNAAADLRANGMGDAVLTQLVRLDSRAGVLERRSAWSLGMASGIVTLANGLAAMGMIVVGANAVAEGNLSHPLLAVIALTPLAIVEPLNESVEAIQRWPSLRAVVDRFTPLLAAPAPEGPGDSARPDPSLHRVETISLAGVAARWPGTSSDVFTGVTFTARRGDRVVVTGPSGSGKSTLLSILMGFLRPSGGTYEVDGLDTGSMPLPELRRRISWCPQEAHLFDSTLRGNLLLARPKEDAPTHREMIEVMREVGLGDLLETLPEGLDTRIGSRGSRLSGGQRQRLAIARSLLTDADVILLDEPTAHLDRPSADALMADLRHMLRNRIVVIVTHHATELEPGDFRLSLRSTVPAVSVTVSPAARK